MNITIREPGSALTHFIAMLLALCAAVPLLVRAAVHSGVKSLTAMTVFMISMVLLYAASTIYHSVNCSGRILRIFRKMDHMMIFVLIAGTYTPVCLLTLPKPSGLMLLAAVWGIALVGIFIKGFWITCPKWFSSVLYIAMGWSCLSVLGQLFSLLPLHAFLWLLAGGLIYTAGGIIYADVRLTRNFSFVRHGRQPVSFCVYVLLSCVKISIPQAPYTEGTSYDQ